MINPYKTIHFKLRSLPILVGTVISLATSIAVGAPHAPNDIPHYGLSASQLLTTNSSASSGAIVTSTSENDPALNNDALRRAIDAPNLEAFIRLERAETYVQQATDGWMIGGIPIPLDFDENAPQAWRDAARATADVPAPGFTLFEFDSLPFAAFQGLPQPSIQGFWPGVGGHHLAAAGSSFPVTCLIRGGNTPFRGSLRVSVNNATWSTPIKLGAGEEHSYELYPSASNSSEDDLYTLDLRRDGDADAIAGRQFRMVSDVDEVYWVTGLFHSKGPKDCVVAIVPATAGNGNSVNVHRIEPVSPDLLPSDVRGWGPAKTVMIGAEGMTALVKSPEKKAALVQWVAQGGRLVCWDARNSSIFDAPHQVKKWSLSTLGSGARFSTFGRGMLIAPPPQYPDPDLSGERRAPSPNYAAFFAKGAGRGSFASLFHHAPSPNYAAFFTWALQVPQRKFESGAGDASLFNMAAASEPSIHIPAWPTFASLALVYLAVFGPFSLWLMRRVKRILLVWLVVPALASAFGLAILLAGGLLNHSLRTLNVSTVQVVHSGMSSGEARSGVDLFTPDPGAITVATGNESLLSRTSTDPGTVTDASTGDQHAVDCSDLPSFAESHFTLGGPVDLGGTLQIDVAAKVPYIVVRNQTSNVIPVSYLIRGGDYCTLPAVSAGGEAYSPSLGLYSRLPSGVNVWMPINDKTPLEVRDFQLGGGPDVRWIIPTSPWSNNISGPGAGSRSCVLCVTTPLPESLRRTSGAPPAAVQKGASSTTTTTSLISPMSGGSFTSTPPQLRTTGA